MIETERLVLRDLEPTDEDALAAILADEEVMRPRRRSVTSPSRPAPTSSR